MKRKYIVLIVTGAILLIAIVYFIFNQTIFKSYFMSSVANEPALPYGSISYASSLFDPEKGDFVVFNHESDLLNMEERGYPYIFRLIASEGDTLEIRNGITFVNGENLDKKYTLKHKYRIHKDEIMAVDRFLSPLDYEYPVEHRSDSIYIHLIDSIAQKYKLVRSLTARTFGDARIQEAYNEFWNKDKFGPLIISEGKSFVMGDNRDYSMDSRMLGLIANEKIIGVIKDTRTNK